MVHHLRKKKEVELNSNFSRKINRQFRQLDIYIQNFDILRTNLRDIYVSHKTVEHVSFEKLRVAVTTDEKHIASYTFLYKIKSI